MPLTADDVLAAVSGRVTAKQVADKVGRPVAVVLPMLYAAEVDGRLVRRVDTEGAPTARWSTS